MSEPDEAMVEAVAQVLWEGNSTPFICWADLSEPLREMQYEQARSALSVPVVRDALARDAQAQKAAADAVWMAKLARGGSWPGGMAQAVDSAAERVIRALGTDDDRAALDAVTAALYPSPGDGWGVWGEDDIPARLISEEQR